MVGTVFAQTPSPVIRERTAALQSTAQMLTYINEFDLEAMASRYVTRMAIGDVFWAGFGLVIEKLQSDVTSLVFKFTENAEDQENQEEAEIDQPKNQLYSLERIHPESVLFDPTAVYPDLRDSKWIALEFYPTIKEIKDDPLFKDIDDTLLGSLQKLKKSPTMDEYVATPRSRYLDQEESDEFAQVRIYEIWDRVNLQKIYMPAKSSRIIGQEAWPVELRYNGQVQFPMTMLYFNENPDEFYPIPELSLIAPQIKQYSVMFRQVLIDAVTKWRKFFVLGNALEKGHEARLIGGPSHSVITVDGNKLGGGNVQDIDLRKMVVPIPDPAVPQDVLQIMGMVKQLMHEIIGAGDFASAGFRSTRSATEAAQLADFLKSRMTSRTENVDSFFKHMVMIHTLFLQETLTEKRSIEVSDVNGFKQWKEFDRTTLKGEFNFSVIAGSSMPMNTETYRQEVLAFFQQIFPAIQQQGANIKPLIEWVAPFYRMPPHILDQMYNNHKQALQQLALMFAMAHQGAKVPGAQLMDAIAGAVNSGLSQAEVQAVTQQASQQNTGQQQKGLPGTNNSPQTM
jgi:hypothetical protein